MKSQEQSPARVDILFFVFARELCRAGLALEVFDATFGKLFHEIRPQRDMWLIGDRRADQGSAVEASLSGCHYAFLRGLVHNGTGRGLTTSRRRARDASSSRPVSFIVSSRLALPIAATARSVAIVRGSGGLAQAMWPNWGSSRVARATGLSTTVTS